MEQTVILNLEVDQAKAVTDLQKTERALLNLKDEQKELNAEYKKGNISQDEYVKHNIRLQQSIKKESDQKRTLTKLIETESGSRNALRQQVSRLTKEYENLNTETAEGIKRADQLEKELAQLNSQLTKGDKAAGLFKNQIGNYPDKFGEAAKSVNIAGTSVGDLGTKLAAFANPATAAVTAVTALAGLYSQSAAGAKDAAFATDVFSAAISGLAEDIGDLAGDTEGGKGIFSQITQAFIGGVFGVQRLLRANVVAGAKEQLRELELIAIDLQGIRKQYEKTAEEARRVRDDEEESTDARLKAADTVTQNLNGNLLVRQSFYNREIEQLQLIAKLSGNSPEIRAAIKKAQAESLDAAEEITGKLTENVKAREAILKLIQEQARADKRAATPGADLGQPSVSDVGQDAFLKPVQQAQIQADAITKLREETARRERQLAEKQAAIIEETESRKLAAITFTLRTAAGIFDQQTAAYRILASADAIVNTYKGANLALASYPPPFSYIAMAATIAAGLSNVAQINGVQFAEGGYTGPGRKHDPAGVVHAGEVVWSQKDVALAGGPMVADSMRPTSRLKPYADGGFVTNTNISAGQQSLIMANALKNMPNPVVSWTEGRKVGRRVEFREKISRT